MNIISKLEALLFHYGEAIELSKASSILGIPVEECAKAAEEWAQELAQNPSRGITLLRKENKIQLVTKSEHSAIGEAITKDEFREQLTPAALETLSLIAYLGPIPRSTIDYVRGVNSSFTLRALVMRGLVERCDEKGLSFRYRITEQCMKHMGLSSLSELPEHDTYRQILAQFEEQIHSQTTVTAPRTEDTHTETEEPL